MHGGVKASTTGNITGIYDMSGGSWERVAGYVNNGSNNLTSYAKPLLEASEKHKNIYEAITSSGTIATTGNDDRLKNYERMSLIYGNAIYETSSTISSWYSDTAICPVSNNPFFRLGGYYNYASQAGIFHFADAYGGISENDSFRPSVVVY
mgnify:CR=1 FL=1